MKIFYSILLIATLVGCSSKPKETYMGYDVISVPFNIAGNNVVHLPVTNAGVIPAEGNGFKMQFVGFNVGESKVNKNVAELEWGFAFSSTNTEKIESIVIEELAPTNIIKLLARVDKPEVIGGRWQLNLEPINANKVNTPWIFRDKASIYVFRITINLESGKQTVLTQAAWFSKSVLANYAKQILLIENS